MRLYLDEDISSGLLIKLLKQAGHDVEIPADVGMTGYSDAQQMRQAMRADRAILSFNYEDFEDLHLLILESTGHHDGILVVRRERESKKNMSARDIVRALRNLEAAGVPIANQYYVLNQWR